MKTSMLKLKIDMFMMKLKMRKSSVIILSLSLILLICACIAVIIYFSVINHPTERIILSKDMCNSIFKCTPTEFFDKDFDFYKKTGDFREKSYVDNSGNLIWVITKKQREALLESSEINSFADIKRLGSAQISLDYKKITVYAPFEIDYFKEDHDEFWKTVYDTLHRLFLVQNLNGTPYEDIYVDMTYYDTRNVEFFTRYKPFPKLILRLENFPVDSASDLDTQSYIDQANEFIKQNTDYTSRYSYPYEISSIANCVYFENYKWTIKSIEVHITVKYIDSDYPRDDYVVVFERNDQGVLEISYWYTQS